MSDRMSNVEIEDVLSSIRRLVSDDFRTTSRSPSPGPAGAAAPGGKLILTPALRVVEEAPAPVAEVDGEGAVGRLMAAMGAARQPQGAWESETGDPGPVAEAIVGEEPMTAEAALAGGNVADDLPLSAQADDDLPLSAQADGDLPLADAPMADLTDHPAPDDWARSPDRSAAWAQVDEGLPAAGATAWDEAPAAPPGETAVPGWADAAEAEVRRALEEPVFRSRQPQPMSGVAMPDPGGDARAVPLHEIADAGAEEAGADLFAAGEMTFDEEVLRDLVRDIIREELQGTLGERITRNVRKLVRAEIARALATRDFD